MSFAHVQPAIHRPAVGCCQAVKLMVFHHITPLTEPESHQAPRSTWTVSQCRGDSHLMDHRWLMTAIDGCSLVIPFPYPPTPADNRGSASEKRKRTPVLHCHGVLALRDRSLNGALQEESQLQGAASKLAAGSAEGWAEGKLWS